MTLTMRIANITLLIIIVIQYTYTITWWRDLNSSSRLSYWLLVDYDVIFWLIGIQLHISNAT